MMIKEIADKYIMKTYSRFSKTFIKGEGVYLFDENGNKYLDFTAGIAVNALGYGNKNVIDAACNQMNKLFHTSNLYYTEPMTELAQKLVNKSCFDKVFFANSGAEANEAAFKLARKYGFLKKEHICSNYGAGDARRVCTCSKIISMKNSFHGRTLATLTLTGQSKYQKGFSPLVSDILYAEFNNLKSVESLIDNTVCAIFVEPIQGEGGLLPANADFLKGLREICDKYGILLIFDEVQTGIGRTGELFCYQNYGVEPDVLTLAKGLGGGLPIGACLAKDFVAECFNPGDHASTFGGNPVACACSNAVLDEITDMNLLLKIKENGCHLMEKLTSLKCPNIQDVRGVGLMIGVEFDIEVKDVIQKCLDRGLLIIGAGKNVLRFVPPLIISKYEIDKGISILEEVLSAL